MVTIRLNEMNQPLLSWQAVANAERYIIYATTDLSLPLYDWELVDTVEETVFIDREQQMSARFYRVVATIR